MPLIQSRATCFKMFVRCSNSMDSMSCPGALRPGYCSSKKFQSLASAVMAPPQSLLRVGGYSRDAVCAEEETCIAVFVYFVEPETSIPSAPVLHRAILCDYPSYRGEDPTPTAGAASPLSQRLVGQVELPGTQATTNASDPPFLALHQLCR